MPELPEVETVRQTLKGLILNKEIADVLILYKNIVDGDDDIFKATIMNKKILDIKRRGKYLLFELSENTAFYSHLRMEGKYYFYDTKQEPSKHTHLVLCFKDGSYLHYNDVRKFGRVGLIDFGKYDDFRHLGPEPFSESFDIDYCKQYLKKRHKPIKTVLLDQSFVAGIGNIYADEILFLMKIDPSTPADHLSDEDIANMIKATREILKKAIVQGGTTIRSYTSSLGVSGRFQNELGIHTKKTCPICGSSVIKDRIGGRGTYHCPKCQLLK